ncbi:hypothetical protein sr10808 [Sporisorium reilianum SRZ2]|uniref:Uncharacterized protein n=1 Tax=Sporisorium reilianum (strain SRZ2) TaxID=999809 RepID=E6ZZV1_SPORE|nr:hypothetical protein sr10808 [Sporisorium reilianum SRZ2]
MVSWETFITALEPVSTPVSNLLLALSTLPLLITVAHRKRNSAYFVPESLILQSAAALLRYRDVWISVSWVTLLEVIQIVAPAATAWWVVRCQAQLCAALEQEQPDVEPLLEDKPDIEPSSSSTGPILKVHWKPLACIIPVLLGLFVFVPYTLPSYALLRLLLTPAQISFPPSYASALLCTLTLLATALEILQPYPQHARLAAIHALGTPQQLEKSPIRRFLTHAELEKPTAPHGVCAWIGLFPVGMLWRLPALALHMTTAPEDQAGWTAILFVLGTVPPMVFGINMAILAFAPRTPTKTATE